MQKVLCPNCGKEVEIDQALRHQIQEQVLQAANAKHQIELEKVKKEIEEKAIKQAKDELDFKLKDIQNSEDQARKQNKALQDQLLALTQQLRDLKQKDDEREIEMQKKLLDERSKLQETITKSEQEKSNLAKMELQKQLDDTKKALDEALRKAEQKSQQLQGEVLELDLEEQLRASFPTDDILPVPKGVEGGDIWHIVKNKYGNTAGSMLWELKRTKAWSNSWLPKLRENTRAANANISILVSDILPDGIATFGLCENVWVTSAKYAIPLANVLRTGLLQVAIARSASVHKDQMLEALYSYLTKDSFKHRFEAQVESIIELKKDLDTEQRSTIRLWKKREMQINKMTNNIASMYGELQGIMGQALPAIQNLEAATEPTAQTNLLE